MDSSVLKEFVTLCTLTVAVTQVYKEVFSDKHTQKISVCVAVILAFITGKGLLSPLGFMPSTLFTEQLPIMQIIYDILFFIFDLIITGLIASKGSNYFVDLLKGNLLTQGTQKQ